MSNNFWEVEFQENSEDELEKMFEELDENQPQQPSVPSIKTSSETPIQLEGSSSGLTIGWLFTLFWCFFSFLVTVFIVTDIMQDLGTGDWRPVDGVVLSSSVTTGSENDVYCLNVRYEYNVDGTTYQGDKVSFSSEKNCNSWSKNADQDYPKGEEITVYYNPDNPSEAVLNNGLSGVPFSTCCFFAFPMVGLIMLFVMTKESSNS